MTSTTFTLTVRELLASSPGPDVRFVKLVGVDGVKFAEPLSIESIDPLIHHADPDDPSVDFTVWSPKGWMFGIILAPTAQGGREITLTFLEV